MIVPAGQFYCLQKLKAIQQTIISRYVEYIVSQTSSKIALVSHLIHGVGGNHLPTHTLTHAPHTQMERQQVGRNTWQKHLTHMTINQRGVKHIYLLLTFSPPLPPRPPHTHN